MRMLRSHSRKQNRQIKPIELLKMLQRRLKRRRQRLPQTSLSWRKPRTRRQLRSLAISPKVKRKMMALYPLKM